jgi:DNA-binding LacI/PurR family transcriptional regulator
MNQGKRIKGKGICPRCHGTGNSRAFNRYSKYSKITREKAQELIAKGFTLRYIARKLKINHPQTIKNIVRV